MKTHVKILFTLSALIGTGLVTEVTAGIISTADLTNDETQIVNTGGTVISAVNFVSADDGNSTVDINGIIHQVSSSDNLANLDLVAPALVSNFSTFDGQFRIIPSTAAGYTADMRDLMGGIAGASALDIDIFGLTPGTSYLFQTYWEANNTNQVATMTFEGTDVETGITGNGTLGVLISYSFTASDDTLDVQFVKTAGSDNMWLQGYSLQTQPIPEPSSIALLGLSALGLVLYRRFRQR